MCSQTTDKSRHNYCEVVCKHSGEARKSAPGAERKRTRKKQQVRS